MFINDFEVYLMTVGRCNHNTTVKFMQFFKRIVLIARNNGLIVGDPFANYKIRLQRVDRGYLTEDETKKISIFRILVKQAIGGIKKYRIVKERFRCHKFGFDDLVMLIACGLHPFEITNSSMSNRIYFY